MSTIEQLSERVKSEMEEDEGSSIRCDTEEEEEEEAKCQVWKHFRV